MEWLIFVFDSLCFSEIYEPKIVFFLEKLKKGIYLHQ